MHANFIYPPSRTRLTFSRGCAPFSGTRQRLPEFDHGAISDVGRGNDGRRLLPVPNHSFVSPCRRLTAR